MLVDLFDIEQQIHKLELMRERINGQLDLLHNLRQRQAIVMIPRQPNQAPAPEAPANTAPVTEGDAVGKP